MNPRRLYRCRHERQLAGVAAGMAEHLDLDPTLVRILWILSAFFGGFTILLYIILAFVIPLEPATMPGPGAWQPAGPGSWQPAGAGSWQPAGPGSWQPAGPGWGAPPSQAAGTGFDPAAGSSGTAEASGGTEASGGVPDPGATNPGSGPSPVGGTPSPSGAPPFGGPPAHGWAANPEWRAPWPEPHSGRRRGGRAGLYLGILLIIFGAIALIDAVVPGWAASGHLVPAFVVALGAVLVVGSVHRRGAQAE